jgi:multidrug efflux pump subunit AcrA (membrane-fusion protein)
MLYGGEFGRVRVPASADHLALLVAEQAIGTNQGQRYVLIVNDQDLVESRAVQTGQLHGGFREVLRYRTISKAGPDGKNMTEEVEVLKPTDRLIVSGLQRVRPGMKVEPQTVPMETLVAGTKPDTSAAPKK